MRCPISATGDTVRLAVRRDGDRTLIEVSDAGRGPGLGDMAGQPGIERQNALRYSMARALGAASSWHHHLRG